MGIRGASLLIFSLLVSGVSAQSTPSNGATTLTWDLYDVPGNEVIGYRLYYWLQGQVPGDTWINASVDGLVRVSPYIPFDPQPACCVTPPQLPDCICGIAAVIGTWPLALSPVKLVTGLPVGEGDEVCFYLKAYSAEAMSLPSNTVCILWPKVCEFTTKPELLTCLVP